MEQAQTMADVYSAYHDFAFVMMKKVCGIVTRLNGCGEYEKATVYGALKLFF